MRFSDSNAGNISFAAVLFGLAFVLLPVSCLRSDVTVKGGSDDTPGMGNRDKVQGSYLEMLSPTLSGLPADTAEKISAESDNFIQLASMLLSVAENDSNYLLFPAAKGSPLPSGFEPSDLVPLEGRNFSLNKKGMETRSILIDDLTEMINAAASEGIEIMISSAYRSHDYQQKLFDYYTGIYGEEETEKFSARPGTSQHQLGTAMDFGSISLEFRDSDAGKWMADNAWKYGFSLSYPEGYEKETGYEYEPWHFRYITKTGTALEREYFNGLQFVMLEYLSKHGSYLREQLKAGKK